MPLNFWKIIVYEKDGKLSAQGFVMSQESYIKNIKQKATLLEEALEQVNPTLTPASVKELFEKEALVLAQTKISLIEDKTGLSFGLNDADEFKDKPQYALKLISKPKGVHTSFESFPESIDTTKWSSFLMSL